MKCVYIYMYNGILFRLNKEGNPAICDNIDELGGLYTKWNKPDTERQILYDLTYKWNLKKVNLRKTEYNSGCQGLKSEGNEKMLVIGYKLSVLRWVRFRDLMHSMVIS